MKQYNTRFVNLCLAFTEIVGCNGDFSQLQGTFVSGSPQSTLSAFGSGCGCRKGSSSHGSPSSACQVLSPRATWDLLHAAAGEVERMKMNEDGYDFNHYRGGLLGPPRKPSPVTFPVKNNNPEVGFYAQQSLSHQQLQIAQVSLATVLGCNSFFFPLFFNSSCSKSLLVGWCVSIVVVSDAEAATNGEGGFWKRILPTETE